MIHHNPGEEPFETAFSDPDHLVRYGYNGQAFKHINAAVTLDAVAPGVFPGNAEERSWLKSFTAARREEIRSAKEAGLEVYYHIDLFVLPRRIVEHFKEEILDPETGRIDLWRERTLSLHEALFAELAERFPEIDGFIVRVGETYLYDTPYHLGSGAVRYGHDRSDSAMQEDFVRLLRFLREQICVRHGKTLIHRTWDTQPNRFHSSRDFYCAVTDQIEPHPNLVFSIKHTKVDFHRWVLPNPCLGEGKHPQVIEIQCQREYEGKGAYPNYSTKGVIDGFAEPDTGPGIRALIGNPRIEGIYTWSRGGGWYGPYVRRENELWCDLNAYVIAQFAKQPQQNEAVIFDRYAREVIGLNENDSSVFREIALTSLDAVVKGKCCEVFDKVLEHRRSCPTCLWMRDDVLHGMDKLEELFDYLRATNQAEAALEEKRQAVKLWNNMRKACERFSEDCPAGFRDVVSVSVEYGYTLFRAIEAAWDLLLLAHREFGSRMLGEKLEVFDQAWQGHLEFCRRESLAATPYRGVGWHWPYKPAVPGLLASVDALRC